MFSKPFAFAAAIVLSAAIGGCAAQSPTGKQGMMNKASSMKCKQSAEDSQQENKDLAPEAQRDKREGKRLKKAGCPMMAAKTVQPENLAPRDEGLSDKDPHAEHRR